MKTQIQNEITKLQYERDKLQLLLNKIEEAEKMKIKENQWLKIPELNIEVETEYYDKDIVIKDIKIPEGCRLLTLSEFLVCYNKYRSKFKDINETDEVVQQPIDEIKDKYPYWNVWLRGLVGDNRFGIDGSGGLDDFNRARGVRFCRDVRRKK